MSFAGLRYRLDDPRIVAQADRLGLEEALQSS